MITVFLGYLKSKGEVNSFDQHTVVPSLRRFLYENLVLRFDFYTKLILGSYELETITVSVQGQ